MYVCMHVCRYVYTLHMHTHTHTARAGGLLQLQVPRSVCQVSSLVSNIRNESPDCILPKKKCPACREPGKRPVLNLWVEVRCKAALQGDRTVLQAKGRHKILGSTSGRDDAIYNCCKAIAPLTSEMPSRERGLDAVIRRCNNRSVTREVSYLGDLHQASLLQARRSTVKEAGSGGRRGQLRFHGIAKAHYPEMVPTGFACDSSKIAVITHVQ